MRLRDIRLIVLVALAGLLSSDSGASQGPRVFTMYERHVDVTLLPNSRRGDERLESAVTYWKIVVTTNREVLYSRAIVRRCVGAKGAPVDDWSAVDTISPASRYALTAPEFERLITFLNTSTIQTVDSFNNAGAGVGDFRIAIARSSGVQHIDVHALLPLHQALIENDALLRLICRGKQLAQPLGGEQPTWCH